MPPDEPEEETAPDDEPDDEEAEESAPVNKKEALYSGLKQALQALSDRVVSLEGHSNAEIKALTKKIRDLLD